MPAVATVATVAAVPGVLLVVCVLHDLMVVHIDSVLAHRAASFVVDTIPP
jgi:hypothetical protein